MPTIINTREQVAGFVSKLRMAPPPLDLEARALSVFPDTELVPDNSRNRREWIRAVGVVRSTSNGWHLDRQVERRR